MTTRVKLFSGFERFWHLAQLLLIGGLLFTGFNIHGTWLVLPFEQALNIHIVLALSLIGLWVLAIFWDLTTGDWRQYVPTGKGLMPMVLRMNIHLVTREITFGRPSTDWWAQLASAVTRLAEALDRRGL